MLLETLARFRENAQFEFMSPCLEHCARQPVTGAMKSCAFPQLDTEAGILSIRRPGLTLSSVNQLQTSWTM